MHTLHSVRQNMNVLSVMLNAKNSYAKSKFKEKVENYYTIDVWKCGNSKMHLNVDVNNSVLL